MPRKPLRPCSHPGCPNLCDGQFCEQHRVEERRKYDKYERSADVNRKYGRAWKRIRDRYAAEHPLCEMCLKEGRLTPVQEVHHILPVSKGGTHARDNLMSLCQSRRQIKAAATMQGRPQIQFYGWISNMVIIFLNVSCPSRQVSVR